jgi:hypothetical protein
MVVDRRLVRLGLPTNHLVRCIAQALLAEDRTRCIDDPASSLFAVTSAPHLRILASFFLSAESGTPHDLVQPGS